MKRFFLLLLIGIGINSYAQTYTSLSLSGFNADVVANGTSSASASTTNDVDGGGYVFYETGWNPGTSQSNGLPSTGVIPSALTTGLNFQLAGYSSNNSLRLIYNNSGSLTISNPTYAKKLFLLATSGGGSSVMDVTIVFQDNSTQNATGISVADWYGGSSIAYTGFKRAYTSDNSTDNASNGPNLYQYEIAILGANQMKKIKSLTIKNEYSSYGYLNVFAASVEENILTGCNPPFAINYTSNGCSVHFDWSNFIGDTPQSFIYELRTSGAAGFGQLGLSESGTTTNNNVDFVGLSYGVSYSFYIRSVCSTSDSSDWSSPTTFKIEETYIPVAVTGFNQDVIANGAGTPSASTTISVDKNNYSNSSGGGNNYVFFANDYTGVTPLPTGQGLPANGIYDLNNKKFQFADYSGNNVLRLEGSSQTGTLTLVTPIRASDIIILGTSSEGVSTFDALVTFDDNSTQTLSDSLMADWVVGASGKTPYVTNIGRLQREYAYYDEDGTTNNTKLYEDYLSILPANQSKLIKSIKFVTTGSSAGVLNIFAVSIKRAPIHLSLATPDAAICLGNEVKLEGTISNTHGNWTIHLAPNGQVSGSTDGSWSATVAPDGQGAIKYYVEAAEDDITCRTASSDTTVITLPVRDDVLSGDGDWAKCYISGNNPIHFYDLATHHYIGSINPQGRDGWVTMTSSVVSTWGSTAGLDDGTMFPCVYPNSTVKNSLRTAYMKRGFTVEPDASGISGSGQMLVYFPFTNSELSDLETRSSSSTDAIGNSALNTLDNVASIADVVATKFDASAGNESFENNTPTDDCGKGSSVVIPQTASGDLSSPYTLSPAITKTDQGVTETIHYAKFSVDDFSEFFFHGKNNNSPLPIELVNFSATCTDGIHLSWTTATEQDVDYFQIYRSRDGQTWELVGQVDAIGNSSTSNSYQLVDVNGLNTTYYRLVSIDNDGTKQVFNPISVNCQPSENTWHVYPIPVSDQATISIQATENFTSNLFIVSLSGKVVAQKTISVKAGQNLIPLDVRNLAQGIYFIRLQNESKGFTPIKFNKID